MGSEVGCCTMTGWLNTHSYLLLIVAVSGLVLIPTMTIDRMWLRGLILGSAAVLLMAGFLTLRTGTSSYTTQEEVSSALGEGTPVLLEFFSDY